MPDGSQVQAELVTGDSGRLSVSAGNIRFELACLPQDDFPQMSAGALPHRFRLSASDLIALIERTRFAISTEETRFYLNGIYLHAAKDGKQERLRAVATDGHRLARYELDLPDGAKDMPGVIVPRKTVAELRRLLEDADGAIEIGLSDTKVQFTFSGVELTSKLIDGSFPDYQRVIPTSNDKVLTLDAKDFSQAVDRVSTISADKTRAVKLNLDADKVTLSVVNPESGTATEELGANYRADAIEIGFNARYLLDITGQIAGKDVRFLLADAGSPTVKGTSQVIDASVFKRVGKSGTCPAKSSGTQSGAVAGGGIAGAGISTAATIAIVGGVAVAGTAVGLAASGTFTGSRPPAPISR